MTGRVRRGMVAPAIVAAGTVALAMPPAAAAGNMWFRVDKGNLFPNWAVQLQRMVDEDGGAAAGQVCIVGWQRGSDLATQHAYVIWPERHRLIIWIPSNDDPDSLAHQTGVLDLKRDVVADDRLVRGSTYLVTRSWVENVRRHCRLSGTTITLRSAGAR